jgi:hypothetical protein
MGRKNSLGGSTTGIGHRGPIAGPVLFERNVVLKVGRGGVASGGPWMIRWLWPIWRRCKPKRPKRFIDNEGRWLNFPMPGSKIRSVFDNFDCGG